MDGTQFSGKELGHANLLLYDRKYRTLERFEPHGASDIYDNRVVNKFVEQKIVPRLQKWLPIDTYLEPLDFCPKEGFQAMEKSKSIKLDPEGYCSTWAIWYADLRMTYPDLSSQEIVKIAMESVKGENFTQDFMPFVRRYSLFLNQMMQRIRKAMGRSKELPKEEDIIRLLRKFLNQYSEE